MDKANICAHLMNLCSATKALMSAGGAAEEEHGDEAMEAFAIEQATSAVASLEDIALALGML